MAKGKIHLRAGAFLGGLLLVGALGWAQAARAQGAASYADIVGVAQKEAVGVGIYYGWGEVRFSAPPGSATPDEKAYSQLLTQGTHQGSGPALGFSYGLWGLVIGRDDSVNTINHLLIDGAGQLVFVKSVQRINTSVTLLFNPIRWTYIGLGHDTGSLAFKQIQNGVENTKSFGVDNNFYTVGLAFGFNPHKPGIGPIFTVYTKVPLERTPFAVTTNVVGIGLYF